jgi:hypothetical protein
VFLERGVIVEEGLARQVLGKPSISSGTRIPAEHPGR